MPPAVHSPICLAKRRAGIQFERDETVRIEYHARGRVAVVHAYPRMTQRKGVENQAPGTAVRFWCVRTLYQAKGLLPCGGHGISLGERPGHATDLLEFLLGRCDDVGGFRRAGPDFIR